MTSQTSGVATVNIGDRLMEARPDKALPRDKKGPRPARVEDRVQLWIGFPTDPPSFMLS